MTGTPSRKSSPIARASRKLSGVTVAIRRFLLGASRGHLHPGVGDPGVAARP